MEPLTNLKNVEIYTTSAVPVDQRPDWIKLVDEELKDHQKREEWRDWAEVKLSEDETYANAVLLVKEDLIKKYSDAGVQISDSSFPEISLIKPENIKRLIRAEPSGNSGELKNRAEVHLFGPERLFLDLIVLHEEVNHELGREIGIIGLDGEIAVHLGYRHTLKNGINRGQVLEEGVMKYLALEFVLNSKDELCVKAKEEFAEQIRQESHGSENLAVDDLCVKGVDELTWSAKYPRLLVQTLIVGAQRLDPEEGTRMKQDLIKTRVETSNTRVLMERVDNIFGAGTFSKIMKLDYKNPNQIRDLVDTLREKVSLQHV